MTVELNRGKVPGSRVIDDHSESVLEENETMGVKKTGSTSPKRSRKPALPAVPTYDAPTHEAIAFRAHQLFVLRGGGHGRDLEDWLIAERELASSSGDGEAGSPS